MRNKILILCLALFMLSASGMLKAENAKPFVIPELRHWKGAEGTLSVSPATKVLYTDAVLSNAAMEMAADYGLMFGKRMKAKAMKPDAKTPSGAIVISLVEDKELGEEGYSIEIADRILLKAQTATGAYWGTRTLLQIMEQHEGTALPRGIIRDWPDFPVRGYMIDVGRKYVPLDYLEKYARVMAYYKMNTFQIHLNDRAAKIHEDSWDDTYAAFRLESEWFPELTAKDGHYTKDGFRQFQKDAAKRCVNIIPEIDAPAHSLCFSRFREEFGSKEWGLDHLDLFNPNVYTFLDSLFTEYLEGDDPVFWGPNVHIGTDEYSNKDKKVVEKFRAFTDHYLDLVQRFGKQPWMWGALTHAKGNTPVRSENVIMQCWYPQYANPIDMKNQGYKLVCIPSWSTYIVPAAGYYADYLNVKNLYTKWHPGTFNATILDPHDPCLLGGMFAIWNDIAYNGISVSDIHHRAIPATQYMAAVTWNHFQRTVPFDDFDTRRNILSEAPGVNELGRFAGKPNSVVYSLPKVKPGKTYPICKAGFFHTISFTLDAQKEEPGTLLFSNDEAKFWLAGPEDGRMAFQRDGYLYTFNYTLEQGKRREIRIECTNSATRLFVDGKLQDELKREKRWICDKKQYDYVQTLHFPLRKAGKFRSNVTDLKVENFIR